MPRLSKQFALDQALTDLKRQDAAMTRIVEENRHLRERVVELGKHDEDRLSEVKFLRSTILRLISAIGYDSNDILSPTLGSTKDIFRSPR